MITTSHRRPTPLLRPTALAAALLLQGLAHALPQDPRTTFGQAQVTQTAPGTLRIDQAGARAGIDWQSFSIGAGERVHIVQPDAASVLVNRVTGLDASRILGRMDANGRVFLVNPRGVIFGEGAQVNVGSLVASTLTLSDADARAGRWWLQGDANAAPLRNDGTLRATGTVALVAPQVDNTGSIEAPRVALGALGQARVDLDGDGLILFDTGAADGARLAHTGRIAADGGRIELTAQARGQVAGSVLNLRGAVVARGLAADGGRIVVDGGRSGTVEVGAAVDASAAQGRGGEVTVLGERVLVDSGARLHAGGRDGGGQVLVGGDFQGANPLLPNASMVAVQAGAVLDASAGVRGDGGRVIVWSDDATRFAGRADARGGATGGNGGLVEVSGKAYLDYAGQSDRSAPMGRGGTLLLDPVNLTIQAGAPDILGDGSGGNLTTPNLPFAAPGTESRITAAAVVTQLAAGAVVLQASNDLRVTAPITSTGNANALTLQAGGNIDVGGNAPITVGGNLTLSAGDSASPTPLATGAVSVQSTLTSGGTLTLAAGAAGTHQIGAGLTAATLAVPGNAALTGNVTVTNTAAGTLGGALSGTGGVTKAGSGRLDLTGANTFTGTVAVDGGTLAAGAAGALGTGGVTVGPGTTLLIANAALGAVPITMAGGTLAASGTASAGGPVSLAADAAVDVASAGTLRLSGPITESSGPAALTKTGAGTLVLSGNNAYSGGTTIAAGTLRLGDGRTTGTLGSGAVINNGTLTIDRSDAVALANDIAGTGNLVQAGSGTTTLAGTNSYAGTTTVSGGVLSIDGDAALGTAPGAATPGAVVLSGGTLRSTASFTLNGNRGIALGTGAAGAGSGTIETADGTTLAYAGVVADNGASSGSLTKSGAGTLVLSGNSTYTGGTTVRSGVLAIDTGDALPVGTALAVDPAAEFNLGNGSSQTVASFTGGSIRGTGSLSAATYRVTGGSTDASVGLSAGASFDVDNDYTLNSSLQADTVNVNGGTLQLGSANRLASNASVSIAGSATVQMGGDETVDELVLDGTLERNGFADLFTANRYTLNNGAQVNALLGTGTLTVRGNSQLNRNSAANTVNINTGTLTLTAGGRLASGAALVVDGGTLDLGAAAQTLGSVLLRSGSITSGTLTSASRYQVEGGTVGAVLAGTAGLDKLGTGTATLAAANLYGGSTSVLAGTLVVSNAQALGASSAGNGTSVNGGSLVLSGVTVQNETLSLAGSGVGGNGALQAQGSAAYNGAITLAADAAVGGAGRLTLGGTVAGSAVLSKVGSGTLVLDGGAALAGTLGLRIDDGTVDLGGTRSLAGLSLQGGTLGGGSLVSSSAFDLQSGTVNAALQGNVALAKTGPGTVTLNTAASYTGATTVAGGRLALGTDQALPVTTAVTVSGGAALDAGATRSTIAALVLENGSIEGSTGGFTSASTYDLRDGSVSAALDGSVGLAKSGSGTVRLTGANGYGGATQVSGGTLVAASASALGTTAGTTTVARGAALQVDNVAIGSEAITLAGSGIAGAGALLGTGTNAAAAGTITLAEDASIGSSGALLLSGAIEGSGRTLSKTGGGQVSLAGISSYSGATLVQQDTLALTASERLASATTVSIATGATLSLAGNQTVSGFATNGRLAGSGTLTAPTYTLAAGSRVEANLGAGTLTVTGNSTLAGTAAATPVTITAGTLTLAAANRLADTAELTIGNDGALALNGNDTVQSLTLQGTLGGTGTLTAANYVLDGGDAAAALGAGTLVSRGANTLSATAGASIVRVETGQLSLLAPDLLANSADVEVRPNATLALQGNDTVGTLLLAGTLGGTGTLTATRYTLQGATVNANLGSGLLASSGNTTVFGTLGSADIAVTDSLTLASAARLVNAPALSLATGATLGLGGNETLGTLQGSGRVNLGSATLTTGSGGGSSTFAGVLAGSGGLTKVGGGDFTLSGTHTYTGATRVEAGRLATTAADRLPDATAATVLAGATLDLGGDERIASLRLLGTLQGSGTLQAPVALEGGTVNAALGTGELTSTGTSRLNATSAAADVAVTGGVLTLGSAGRLSATPAVRVATGGELALGGDERVAQLDLAGRLTGPGVFSAPRVALAGGTVEAVLGDGELSSTGSSTLAAEAAVRSVRVDGGDLTVTRTLTATPSIETRAGGRLRLDTAQAVGPVTNAGTLEAAAALAAQQALSSGSVVLGSSITTQGSQTYTGPVTAAPGNAAPALLAGTDADIVASNAGNDFGTGALALRGRSVTLQDGADLALGRVELGAGTSSLAARGVLQLRDRLTLADGRLTLRADAVPTPGAAAVASGGGTAFLPEADSRGAAGNRAVRWASDAIVQAPGADIDASAASRVEAQAAGGGSITLANAGNRFGGGITATSGGSAPFDLAGSGTASRILLVADELHLVPNAGGDALRADALQIAAARITAEPGAVLRARLPYGANQGAASQVPALVLDTRQGALGGGFGTLTAPLLLAVGAPNAADGIGGLYLTVLPSPVPGTAATQVVFLGCEGCGAVPFYQYGGDPAAVQTYFNGALLSNAPPAASAITSNTTLLENARRNLFEAAVRTENAAPRLRAGVIAEVGKGRPATEGGGSARRPELCDAPAGALACGTAKEIK